MHDPNQGTGRHGDTGKVALVTGAASGIGKACALRFANAGYRVGLLDRDAGRLDETMALLSTKRGNALALRTDIADPSACQDAADRLLTEWGRIDVLVANAGVQLGGTLLDTPEQDWQTILAVNLNGTALACKAVLPSMLERGAGAIVIVSSVNAIVGTPGMTIYDMSKAAVLGLTRSLATEYGSRGIRVNAVCPGNTLTEFHLDRMAGLGHSDDDVREMTRGYGLLGRCAEPGEIASAIDFLAGENASFITGQVLAVDGGYSVSGRAAG